RRRAGDNRHGQADGPPSHADRLDPARSAERAQGDADRRDRAQRLAAGRIRPVAPGDRPHSSARRSRGSARRDGSWRTCRQDRAGGPMNRTELYALAEAYLDALVAKEPSRLSWAPDAMFTENNVRLEPGDGLWNTISARRPDYDLKAADPSSGQVAWFGIVEEHGHPAIMALRIAAPDGKIAEVETIVCRSMEFGPFPSIETYVAPRPLMLADVPEAERVPRERMIAIANGYFDTLQLNDG